MFLNAWDSFLVPAFIIPGLLAVLVGFLLPGVAELRSGTLARLGFDGQNWQALMAIQLGVGRMVVAYALWSGAGSAARQRARA